MDKKKSISLSAYKKTNKSVSLEKYRKTKTKNKIKTKSRTKSKEELEKAKYKHDWYVKNATNGKNVKEYNKKYYEKHKMKKQNKTN